MTTVQWNIFSSFRDSFKSKCITWSALSQELYPLQKDASLKDTPSYPLQTAVVYNQALDEITSADDIHLIVIGDNPGKEEQLSVNRKYLVGQSGRIAEGFFRRNPEFNTDFRKNVIILNKTPIHTAKTAHLQYLLSNGSPAVKQLILESQLWMAQATAILHQSLFAENKKTQLWLVGYAELKGKKGLFLPYRDELKKAYSLGTDKQQPAWNSVFVYQHFSMNRFLIDEQSFCKVHTDLTLSQALTELGQQHRDEIFVQ